MCIGHLQGLEWYVVRLRKVAKLANTILNSLLLAMFALVGCIPRNLCDK